MQCRVQSCLREKSLLHSGHLTVRANERQLMLSRKRNATERTLANALVALDVAHQVEVASESATTTRMRTDLIAQTRQ